MANTLLVVSNPSALNFVIGYGNNNTPEQTKSGHQYLSASESHSWAIDKAGHIHDATPDGNLTPEDAAKLRENFSGGYTDPLTKRQRNRQLIVDTTIFALASTVGLWKRKQVKRVPSLLHRTYAKMRLGFSKDVRIAHTLWTLNHVLYSKNPQAPPSFPLNSKQVNKKEALSELNNNFVKQPDYQKLQAFLRQPKDITNRQVKRALRHARRIMRWLNAI